MVSILLKGFIIGIFVSAPVGPIGMLCMQRTLNGGRAHGFTTALGAISSDLIYAIVAIFSISFIIDFIELHHFTLQIIGSVIVFIFGLYTYILNPVKKLTKYYLEKNSYIQNFFTSFGLTITNPLVIFLFIALIAKFSIVSEDTTFWHNIAGILFIMLGACFWWVVLVNLINFFRNRLNPRRLYWVNRLTGVAFMLLGVISLVYTLFV